MYFACPCTFEINFPERLGGQSMEVTLNGVLVYQAVMEGVEVFDYTDDENVLVIDYTRN
jgi:hypothetical protein